MDDATRRIEACCHAIEDSCNKLGQAPEAQKIRQDAQTILQCCKTLSGTQGPRT